MSESNKLNASNGLYQFGPFRLESRERRLLKEGSAIGLPPKVFDTLRLLVENAGHVVTKGELMAALWPETAVEEGNLTKNVWLIRKALGEAEGENRYIETVPKAGYRFVASVRQAAETSLQRSIPAPPPFLDRETAPAPGLGRKSPRVFAIALAAFLGVVLGVFWLGSRHPRAGLTAGSPGSKSPVRTRRSVAVLGFQNLSGRPDAGWLSTAVSEMVSAELAGGEKLRLVPAESVARFGQVGRPAIAGTLSRETLANLRANLDADVVLSGSYVALPSPNGGAVRFDMTLQDTSTGESLATVSETGNQGDLFRLVSSAGERLRSRLGLAAVSESGSGDIAASLPKDPEAARLYADGLAKIRAFDALAARPLLETSIRMEPGFGPAHAALSETWSALGYDENARTEAEKSFRLAGGSPSSGRATAG